MSTLVNETDQPVVRRRGLRSRAAVRPLLLVVAFGLLLITWAGSSPLGFEPDGPEHFVRSVGAGTGQFLGEPGRIPHAKFGRGPSETIRLRWINGATRSFEIPAKFGNRFGACGLFRTQQPLTCYRTADPPTPRATRQTSYVGTYDPLIYGAAGMVMARLPSRNSAYYAGRLVNAALTLLMLGLAVRLAWSRRAGPLSLLGIALAATPTLLFLGGSLGTNGVEAASAVCLWTVVLRSAPSVTGRLGPSSRSLWWIAGLSAAVCAVSRSTGPVWVALAALLAIVLHGPRGVPGKLRAVRRTVLPLGVLIVVCCAFTLGWYAFVQPHPGLDLGYAAQILGTELRSIPQRRLHQWVGSFSWMLFGLPVWVHRLWVLTFLGLGVTALVAAGRRQALRLVGGLLLLIALLAAINVLVFLQTRFPGYARYLLALVVVVPLAIGEVLTRTRISGRLPTRVAAPVAAVGFAALAVVEVLGIWTNARRYAVGLRGPFFFAGASQWAPPGGWSVWLGCTLLAGGLMVVAGLPRLSRPRLARAGSGGSFHPPAAAVPAADDAA